MNLDKGIDDFVITPGQCRAARGVLNLSQADLAALSNVSKPTITDFERGIRQPYKRTLRDLRAALEAKGVAFFREEGGRVGVSFQEPGPPGA